MSSVHQFARSLLTIYLRFFLRANIPQRRAASDAAVDILAQFSTERRLLESELAIGMFCVSDRTD